MRHTQPAKPMILIRLGELDDLHILEQIERETACMFAAADLPAELAQPLPTEKVVASIGAGLLWVAEEDSSEPVGFILCENRASSLHILEMDVRPSFGRRGIGTKLLLHACAAANKFGLRFVTLTTFSHLAWNAPFYMQRGFGIAEEATQFPHLAAALRREFSLGLRNRIAMFRHAA